MACTLTIADLAPEFAEVDSALFDLWLSIATAEVDVVAWEGAGVDSCEGIKLLTMHYLAKAGVGSTAASEGEKTSERVGEISVSYAATKASSSGEHGSTVYGQAFDALYKRVPNRRRRAPMGVCR